MNMFRLQPLQKKNILDKSNFMPTETRQTQRSSKKMFLGKLIMALPIVASLGTFSPVSSADILYLSDFETGAIQHPNTLIDGWGAVSLDHTREWGTNNTSWDMHVTSTRARSGKKAVRMNIDISRDYSNVNGGGDDKPRNNLSKPQYRFDYNTDYWVGWSVFLPSDWVDEYDNGNYDTLTQLHTGASGGSPIVNLAVKGSTWEIRNRWDENNVKFVGGETVVKTLFNESAAKDKGKWTDWVMRFRLCHQKGCNGIIQIWKNGEKVVNFTGPNAYKPIDKGPYISLNLYKGAWKKKPTKVSSRTIYFDEIRVGDAKSNLLEVSPPKAKAPQKPNGLSLSLSN